MRIESWPFEDTIIKLTPVVKVQIEMWGAWRHTFIYYYSPTWRMSIRSKFIWGKYPPSGLLTHTPCTSECSKVHRNAVIGCRSLFDLRVSSRENSFSIPKLQGWPTVRDLATNENIFIKLYAKLLKLSFIHLRRRLHFY